jgi:hypothetical protein
LELKPEGGWRNSTLSCSEASLEEVAEREKQIVAELIRRFDEERKAASKGSKKAKL